MRQPATASLSLVVALLGALGKTASSASHVCPYDYSIIKQVSGNVNYRDPPIKVLKQSGTSVTFVVGNTWTDADADADSDESLDQMFTVYKSGSFDSFHCILEENVPGQRVVLDNSSKAIEAQCSTAGLSKVNVYVSDSTFVVDASKTGTAEIPKCCHDPSPGVSKGTSLFEYIFVINCVPTCPENETPNSPPTDSPSATPSATSSTGSSAFSTTASASPTASAFPTALSTDSPSATTSGSSTTMPTNSQFETASMSPSAASIVDDTSGDIVKQALPSPEDAPLILDYKDGDIFELDNSKGKDSLSMLLRVDLGQDGNVTGKFVPVGRSYNGHPWENYANEFSTSISFDCNRLSSCRVALPPPGKKRAYLLKSKRYSHHLTKDDLKARFLERTTFGSTKSEINAFESPEEWIEQQFGMEITSHRAFYRERATHWHAETNQIGILSDGPCDKSARYRRHAIIDIDKSRHIKIEVSPYDSSKLVLSIDGLVRTIVDGPLQYVGAKGIKVTVQPSSLGGNYEICSHPFDGIGGRLMLRGKGFDGCKPVSFNDVYGNPAVDFDDRHTLLLDQPIVQLESTDYKEIMKSSYFQGKTEMLNLTSNLNKVACNFPDDFVTGFPERVIIARTEDAVNGTQYWIHTPTFKTQNNELKTPLLDGGKKAVELTQSAKEYEKRFRVFCSNAPRTFLNEDFCQLSENACSAKDPDSTDYSTSIGKFVVCGSPFEVATLDNDKTGPRLKGGFDMRTRYNSTTGGDFRVQRATVWVSIALWSQDQLRQRVAFALSQIFSVSPDAVGSQDFTESYVSYYDIFVRHAFGNYFDIMKEVTYHPVMAHMLTYRNGVSTAYSIVRKGVFTTPDENYAREIMQLFSIGLKMLNNNGTIQVVDGVETLPYTNEDIAEYAKVYVGLTSQQVRGNVDGVHNMVDPLSINLAYKDHLPKMGMKSKYIGDGYPLCGDLPSQHFLKKGATYRLLGADPIPELVVETTRWDGAAPKRISLNFTASPLALALCNGNGIDCNPQAKVTLTSDMICEGIECDIHQPRSLEVAKDLWFEYVRPPCVNKAFYNNGKTIKKRAWASWGRMMCGNPESMDASTLCCSTSSSRDRPWRKELFSNERVTFETASGRCPENEGLRLCKNAYPAGNDCTEKTDLSGYKSVKNGGCDNYHQFYWLSEPCALNVKIGVEGSVAMVHNHSDDDTYKMVKNNTRSFFRVDWKNSSISDFLSEYSANCDSMGCFVDSVDGVCQCDIQVYDAMAFLDESELVSVDNVLANATFGAFPPLGPFVPTGTDNVQKYPSGKLSEDTVFKVTDFNGQTQYRKNLASTVKVGNGKIFFRNPVSFWSLSETNVRDARYELDAALEHYFFHQNVAPFVAYRLAQRFGTSNPSPRYIDAIATAFRKGTYVYGSKSVGSDKYGCLQATIAAVVLDREAQDHILDADPTSGQLREPLLKLVQLYRSLDFAPDANYPLPRFHFLLHERIGQAPHKIPNVFSFFEPQYSPPGHVSEAGMVSPESQVLNGPTAVNTMNLFLSHLKYGVSNCYGGMGCSGRVATGWKNNCAIGNNELNPGNNKYLPITYGLDEASASEVIDDLATLLTSGRLSSESRDIMKKAFNDTLESGKDVFEAMINMQQLMVLSPEFHTTGLVQNTMKERPPAPKPNATDSPYKAIIHVMLGGGMDSFNVLAPESCSGKNAAGQTVDKQYLEQRGILAFDRKKGEFDYKIKPNTEQPCESFAVNKALGYMKQLYDEGDLLFLANTGIINANGLTKKNYNIKTRTRLFDHSGGQREVKRTDPYDVHLGSGVLGRAKDILATKGHVVDAMSINFRSVSVSGSPGISSSTKVVNQGGPKPFGSRPNSEKYFDISKYAQKMNSATDAFSSIFGETWSDQFVNGIDDASDLQKQLAKVEIDKTIWNKRDSSLHDRLKMIAQLIKTRDDRNSDRDVFYTDQNNFDHHSDMKTRLDENLRYVNNNLRMLVEQLKADNLWDNVTIVVSSEFGRTITPNNNEGSDHAWGGNYWILGGQVKGGRVVGKYPDDLTKDGPLNAGSNSRVRFIPTTSWDSVWHGIVQWFGVEDEVDLDYCLPNRNNTISPVVGAGQFPLLKKEDLFKEPEYGVASARKLRG